MRPTRSTRSFISGSRSRSRFLLLQNFIQLLLFHASQLLYDGMTENALPLVNSER